MELKNSIELSCITIFFLWMLHFFGSNNLEHNNSFTANNLQKLYLSTHSLIDLHCNNQNHQVSSIKLNTKIKVRDFVNYFAACKGWYTSEDWGMWSDGQRSEIKLNTKGVELSQLIVRGGYFQNALTTKVWINGEYLGKFDLTKQRFFLHSLAKKLKDNLVIELEHNNPSLSNSKDTRKMEFGLTSLEFY